MEWLKNFLAKNHLGFIKILLGLVSITFVGNLIIAMSDGVIDPSEYHNLATGANGFELVVLFVLTQVLKVRK